MWSPPPQKTQGLEGGKPRWVDSFLISEVCPILSETNWVLAESCCYLIFMEVCQRWMTGRVICPHFSHLDSELGWLFTAQSTATYPALSVLQVYFIGTPPVSTADLCRPYKGVKEVRALDNGEAICWESESPKSSLNGTCLAGKEEPRKSRSLRIVFFPGFWAFCWCLLLPSWFVWLLCVTTDSPMKKCHTSSKSCHTYTSMWRLQTNGQPTSGESINQLAGSRG